MSQFLEVNKALKNYSATPLDAWYTKAVGFAGVPYESVTEANALVPIEYRYVGRPALIMRNGIPTRYMWVGDLMDDKLIIEDQLFTESPAFDITSSDVTNWNTAYGWGNHASANYLSKVVGGIMQASILMSAPAGIDSVPDEGHDVLNLGTSNAAIINIGWSGAVINVQGTMMYQNVENLAVADKLIRLNAGGSTASGVSSGFEIEEGGNVTGWFATDATRTAWDFKAPGVAHNLSFALDLLSADRVVKVPNATGTLLIDTVFYSNPSWLTALHWNKITNTPTTIDGYGITDGVMGTGGSGRVAVWNGTRTLTSYTDLFWDVPNARLGVGTETPECSLDVRSGGTTNVRGIQVSHYDHTTAFSQAKFIGRRARGSMGNPSALLADDSIVSFNGRGYKTLEWSTTIGGMYIYAASNWNDFSTPTYITFRGVSTGVTVEEWVRISAGNIRVSGLSGVDNRMLITDSAGWISAIALPYTKTEINNFFAGTTAITGYNKTNWDTAFSWGNHASAGYVIQNRFVFDEEPSGVKNGVNRDFTLANVPVKIMVFVDGQKMKQGASFDYVLIGSTIRFSADLTITSAHELSATYIF